MIMSRRPYSSMDRFMCTGAGFVPTPLSFLINCNTPLIVRTQMNLKKMTQVRAKVLIKYAHFAYKSIVQIEIGLKQIDLSLPNTDNCN